MESISTLTLLFSSAFMAASILPAQSEILLGSLISKEVYDVYLLIAVASLGNVLGSVLNYGIGKYLMHFQDHKYFPIKKNLLKKAEDYFHKYDSKILLFAWAPVIGDPLTIIAGAFRTKMWVFLVLVTIGKSIRYSIIALFVLM
ncbi:MAG TPA: hypothetical protein DCL21_05195 [Alphaproteobacteria bacterium]|nr:hypothetical protein [Alphaproteobacteria bacterium]